MNPFWRSSAKHESKSGRIDFQSQKRRRAGARPAISKTYNGACEMYCVRHYETVISAGSLADMIELLASIAEAGTAKNFRDPFGVEKIKQVPLRISLEECEITEENNG
jgi:hypothetical protein